MPRGLTPPGRARQTGAAKQWTRRSGSRRCPTCPNCWPSGAPSCAPASTSSALAGLEIAPLAWPTCARRGAHPLIDHFDTATLRARYRDDPAVPGADIVEVDALWGARTLAECLDGDTVDYVIASHVGEHVPDLVTWLGECDAVLAPGGELRLVLPDRRFRPTRCDATRR